MTAVLSLMSVSDLVLALAIASLAGLIKGIVGLAMPTILISGLSSFLAPELALAGLILPTMVSNGIQALRQGPRAAVESVLRFRVFLLVGLVFLLGSAQLVTTLPTSVFLLGLGALVAGFALMQLGGMRFQLTAPSRRIEAMAGAITGFIGGLSGVWGPPTVAYLTALNTPKADQMRAQGVIYGLGAFALVGAHIGSGVLNARTVPFSLVLLAPAIGGMWVGQKLHDRVDQETFRKLTLAVLLFAGLNLVRRGLTG